MSLRQLEKQRSPSKVSTEKLRNIHFLFYAIQEMWGRSGEILFRGGGEGGDGSGDTMGETERTKLMRGRCNGGGGRGERTKLISSHLSCSSYLPAISQPSSSLMSLHSFIAFLHHPIPLPFFIPFNFSFSSSFPLYFHIFFLSFSSSFLLFFLIIFLPFSLSSRTPNPQYPHSRQCPQRGCIPHHPNTRSHWRAK